jgi:hypothetical protein
MKRLGIATAAFALACSLSFATAYAQGIPGQPGDALPSFDAPPDDAPSAPRATAARSAGRYFIDFRARSALSYGHSYVVFGRVGERLTNRNVAGLHPKGDSSLTYIIGHLLPVDSETGASDGDLDDRYTTARFRIWLTPSQYREVVRHIREVQANSPAWHAATYNCNAFIGTIAHFVGLTSPPTWLFPDDFINSMYRMNGNRNYAVLPAGGADAMARHVRR